MAARVVRWRAGGPDSGRLFPGWDGRVIREVGRSPGWWDVSRLGWWRSSAPPEADLATRVPRGQDRAVAGERQGADLSRMADQRAPLPSCGRVPELDGAVVVARGDRLPVGRVGHG